MAATAASGHTKGEMCRQPRLCQQPCSYFLCVAAWCMPDDSECSLGPDTTALRLFGIADAIHTTLGGYKANTAPLRSCSSHHYLFSSGDCPACRDSCEHFKTSPPSSAGDRLIVHSHPQVLELMASRLRVSFCPALPATQYRVCVSCPCLVVFFAGVKARVVKHMTGVLPAGLHEDAFGSST